MIDDKITKLIESARLSGSLDTLLALRTWVDEHIAEAQRKHEELRETVEEGGNQ